jgi:hypothetical protein
MRGNDAGHVFISGRRALLLPEWIPTITPHSSENSFCLTAEELEHLDKERRKEVLGRCPDAPCIESRQ